MRLIDADALIESLRKMYRAAEKWGYDAKDEEIKIRAESCMAGLVEVKLRIEGMPTIDAVEVVRCGKCRHYQGNHDVLGCAPCAFWGIGAVMWDDFCKRGERWDG